MGDYKNGVVFGETSEKVAGGIDIPKGKLVRYFKAAGAVAASGALAEVTAKDLEKAFENDE